MRHASSYPLILLAAALLTACVGTDFVDDAVEPELRIGAIVDTLGFGESLQLEATYFDQVGAETSVTLDWESDRPDVLSINESGLATAIAPGRAVISASYTTGEVSVRDTASLVVGAQTVVMETSSRSGRIESQSSYELTGGFEVTELTGSGIEIEIADDYVASTALPGLYIYLSNNDGSIQNALEIGAVEVFEGAHSYTVTGVAVEDYRYLLYWCKPFSVRVGSGELLE